MVFKGTDDSLKDKYYLKREVLKMPGGDGTGPAGLGPMTGRGMGYCAGNDSIKEFS